ncbi:putative uncharacterized protein DDB_G0286901 [Folsomia candida]|uniref:putative uncharacterized protein DDB_G0286901 n=1 Tax=Folsomia candida TaxID=158441 RepID=UPI000B8F2FC4|nr:putative uncharacterized protein DDB_G0286901 [Folsomia candida]
MLSPEEEQPATKIAEAPPLELLNSSVSQDISENLLKILDFEFTKPNESGENCSAKLHISDSEDTEELEKKSEKESVPLKLETDDGDDDAAMSPTAGYDSNVTTTSSEQQNQEDVSTVLKELENKVTPEPSEMSESIVRATFVDFSTGEEDEEDQHQEPMISQGLALEELINTEELGKEFSLTLNPDLPKIRAQQIQNWLEFEKEATPNKQNGDDDNILENNETTQRSREASPPQDFELDSLTMMGGGVARGGNTGPVVNSGVDHTVTDADGLQRRVRFLTDPQGNILISVFLTNVDGEEEEQQQVIHLGEDHELPDGMNFPEIESQLAAFVSHAQQNKPDLVDTDKILKELGVEKDEEDGEENNDQKAPKAEDDAEGGNKTSNTKTRISAGPSLSVFDDGDDAGSDSETMSTSSCSSMIEVKPKENEPTCSLGAKLLQVVNEEGILDENNNQVMNTDKAREAQVITKIKDQNNSSNEKLPPVPEEEKEIVLDDCKIPEYANSPSKHVPTLVDVELKGTLSPPTSEQTYNKSAAFLDNNNNNGNILTLQVVGVESPPSPPHPEDDYPHKQRRDSDDDAEAQLESLCIEEEPISAVALTIAKWENFSRKQQQQAESGEKVSIAVKGLGKLILPMYPGGNYPNSAPIKMAGPATPMKPVKKNNQNLNGSGGDRNQNNNGNNGCNKNNGTATNGSNKLWNGCGWGNGNNSTTNNNNTSSKCPNVMMMEKMVVEYEEESIYEKPNSQAGCLSITTSASNPSTLLKSYPKPNSRGEIVNWFKEGELYRSGILLSYAPTTHHTSPHIVPQPVTAPVIVSWFFGLITRQQAEELLLGQPTGTFLVRISTRIWGYTLSYQFNNKTKHFLLSAINPAVAATLNNGPGSGSDQNNNNGPTGKQHFLHPFSPGGKYAFIGTNMTPYSTLTSLIRHHSHAPITKAGGEKLIAPCPGGPKISGIEYVFK